LSWGQVGKRYQQKQEVVDTRDYLLLRTEKDCDLSAMPCAAFAPDYAIVVKLEKNRGWQTLLVRTAGQPLTEHSTIKMSFEPESSLHDSELLPIRFRQPDTWYSDIQLPSQEKTSWKLRVKIDQDKHVWVADYPLPSRASK